MNEYEKKNEIGDFNLNYLLLAQRLVQEDAAKAMFRLGISSDMAKLLANLSPAQMMKLSSSSLFLCRFSPEDHPVFSGLIEDVKLPLQQARASTLLSGQHMALAS